MSTKTANASRTSNGGLLPERCLDCGAQVLGDWCQDCGQHHAAEPRAFRTLVSEALADLLTLDSRLARTLRALVLRPGFLTNEYLAGRRSRYVPPFRLYLGISLFYFVTLAVTGATRFFFFNVWGADEQFAAFVRLLPRLMFLLLPAFALLALPLYRKSRRLYVDHFIFALHFHAYAFLVLPVDAVIHTYFQRSGAVDRINALEIVAIGVAAAVQLSVGVHLFLALRRVHGEGRVRTFFKTVVLLFTYLVLLAAVGVLAIPTARAVVWSMIRS